MTYQSLMYLHLATIVPCIFIGGILLIIKKGTPFHVVSGRVYMILMILTSLIALLMPAHVGGYKLFNHFGWLHIFSVVTLVTVPRSYWAIKSGNVKSHKWSMILLYVGAILIAGSFTLMPGRYLHTLFWGN